MTGEAECLLATLRHTSTGVPPSLDWPALLELAASHGVLMIFHREFPGELPQEFGSRARSQWTTSALLTSELESLLRKFSQQGINVIPLKGPLLASLLYGSPTLRAFDDLDLLVQPADLPQASALLTGLGFVPVTEADDYHQSYQRGEILIELHFAVAPPSSPAMDMAGAWARARIVEFRGQAATVLAPPDLLIYLIIHEVKHSFARLLGVLDVSLALAALNGDEVDEVVALARVMGIEGALLTACELARICFATKLPRLIAGSVARTPLIAVHAEAILEMMLQGPADLTTTHQGAGLFLQLETSPRARWAQRLRFFLPSRHDLAWAQSHKINARWMLLLRPLRLLLKHGPLPAWRLLSSPLGETRKGA